MDNTSSFIDWQMLMLFGPSMAVMLIFAYLLWSDNRYYKQKREKTANK